MENYEKLSRMQEEIKLFESIQALLEWDQNCFMPPKAASYRGRQIAKLAKLGHGLQTSTTYEKALEGARREVETCTAEDPRRINVLKSQRLWARQKRLPSKLVEELAATAVSTHALWEKARLKRDFRIMKDGLACMVDLLKQKAECLGYEQHPYDALIPDFEWGMSVAKLDRIFVPLKDELTALIRKCQKGRHDPRVKLNTYTYPPQQQALLAEQLATQLSFSFEDGVCSTSSHPFSTTLGSDDFRITTRYNDHDFLSGFFAVAHEVGHSLYERGLPKAYFNLPIGRACSAGIHESQSLFWEARIASSQSFLTGWVQRFKEIFPQLPADLDGESLYKSANQVTPSLIRIDADEVTYALHIILRYEIEKDLINGALAIADLPEIWRHKYQSSLDISPRDDLEGCLQDIHWSLGLFGYFPSYALGHIFSAQFAQKLETDLGPLEGLVGQGKLPAILGWLQTNIHQHGAIHDSDALVQRVTATPISHQPFIHYLQDKYGKLYGF